ncbi:hypothetical protein ILUMI_12102 [Ignelater luminosus]|uniref:Peptidase S1 domain-containing protein n=1 Tax=Ignelater luminosus TaxID=2038154 RepID=A0A8K0CUY4_IGNLU|nr:hypothetical protein ILUMI_12102 [Ignelater luminosus]
MIIKWVIILTCLHPIFEFYAVEVDQDELFGLATGDNKILGRKAYLGELSFNVIFYEKTAKEVKSNYYLTPICSGAVISERWILTTAKPLGGYRINTYFMLAGVLQIVRLPSEVFKRTRNIYYIEVMIVHPQWHEYDYNDIGIAKTSRNLRFGKELGIIKLPSKFIVPDDNKTVCSMNIWAADTANEIHHLLGYYQTTRISKQEIKLIVANGPKFCPDNVFTNKTLCLIQDDDKIRHDICSVNYGAIIRCKCESVGLFNGFKGYPGCVDVPPLRYTAVNLVEYVEWVRMITSLPTPSKHHVHKISESSFIYLNAKLTYLSFTVILVFD